MSAFMCSDDHISALAKAMEKATIVPEKDAQQYFQMLVLQNAVSLNARYDDAVNEYVSTSKFNPRAKFASVPEAIKNCHCYAYQACEDDGWDDSEAKACVDALEAMLLNKLGTDYETLRDTPKYEAAAWGI